MSNRVQICKLPRPNLGTGAAASSAEHVDILNSLLADARQNVRSRKRKREQEHSEGSSGTASRSSASSFRVLHRITISVESLTSPGATELLSCTPATVAAALQAAGGSSSSSGKPPSSPSSLSSSVLSSYECVAVAPGDVATLRAVVQAGIADILVLDLHAGKLPFQLSAADVQSALSAGLLFEVCYSPAIRDATLRRFLLSNTATLLRLTKGGSGARERHDPVGTVLGKQAVRASLGPGSTPGPLLLCSAAQHSLEVRSQADAAAILALAGVSSEVARRAASEAPAAVLAHAQRRLGGAPVAAAQGSTSGALYVRVQR